PTKQTRRLKRKDRPGVALGWKKRGDRRRAVEEVEGAECEPLCLVQRYRQKRAGNQKDRHREISASIIIKLRALVERPGGFGGLVRRGSQISFLGEEISRNELLHRGHKCRD